MKIAILTSIDTRHRYLVNALRPHFDVVAVGYEKTGYSPADTRRFELTVEEQRYVTEHFAERTRQEGIYFGDHADFLTPEDGAAVLQIKPGKLNDEATATLLRDSGAEAVVVYGTNLVREPLLSQWSGRMLNLHLGLSPHYRGTATNFYPLLNGEPEYVGATIHLIDAGIDTGAIVRHARPEIVEDDMPHTIGCKAILAGIEAMLVSLHELAECRMQTTPQWDEPKARLYLRKHYHPRQVADLYRKLAAGMIPQYVAQAPERAARVRLVSEYRSVLGASSAAAQIDQT